MTVELPIVSFVSALLVLVPLPWHWKTRNVCTTSTILWLAAINIIRTINIAAWLDNDDIKYKIWCDIVTRVELGANVGVPAATACICRRLAHASTPYYKAPSPSEKRQRARFEIGMCVVLPIVLTSLHVIVQSCRFKIIEGHGCRPCYYRSVPALFIQQVPPILLSWAALIYSGVTLRWLIHRRVQFQKSQTTQITPTSNRYLRLASMTITHMTFASVMSIFLITIELHAGVYPWTSWEDIHEDWHEIYVSPKESMPELFWVVNTVGWYFVPIASIATFGHFAFDDRVVAEYRSMFAWVKSRAFCIRARTTVVPPMSSARDTVPHQVGLGANDIAIEIMMERQGANYGGPASAPPGLAGTQS